MFAPGVAAVGVAAVFAFPVRVGRVTIGVLDLYRDTPGRLTDQALTEALAWAGAAAEVLLALQARVWPPTELHPQLTCVTADRVEIHQATGAIVAQTGVSLVDALLLLRARAYATAGRCSRCPVTCWPSDPVRQRRPRLTPPPDGLPPAAAGIRPSETGSARACGNPGGGNLTTPGNG